jgi:hypothetical protein
MCRHPMSAWRKPDPAAGWPLRVAGSTGRCNTLVTAQAGGVLQMDISATLVTDCTFRQRSSISASETFWPRPPMQPAGSPPIAAAASPTACRQMPAPASGHAGQSRHDPWRSNETLPYNLYSDTGRTSVWDDGSAGTATVSGSGSPAVAATRPTASTRACPRDRPCLDPGPIRTRSL